MSPETVPAERAGTQKGKGWQKTGRAPSEESFVPASQNPVLRELDFRTLLYSSGRQRISTGHLTPVQLSYVTVNPMEQIFIHFQLVREGALSGRKIATVKTG